MKTAIIVVAVMALYLFGNGSADCECDIDNVVVCDTEGNSYPNACELGCEGKTLDKSKTFNSKSGSCE